MKHAAVLGPFTPLTPPDSASAARRFGTPIRKCTRTDASARVACVGIALRKAALPVANAAADWVESLENTPLLQCSSAVQVALDCHEQLEPNEESEQPEQPEQPEQSEQSVGQPCAQDPAAFRRLAGRLVSTKSYVLGELFWDCGPRFGDLNELLRAAKCSPARKRASKKRRAA